MMKTVLILPGLLVGLLACGVGESALVGANPTFTPTIEVVEFTTPTSLPAEPLEPTLVVIETETPTPLPTSSPLPAPTLTPLPPTATPPPTVEVTVSPEPLPTVAIEPATVTPPSEPSSNPGVDFVVRYARMRTNQENSWDGTLGPGNCGSDHSIYVHVADAQENLLDGILIGDRYGNFEVPTGMDGPGVVRILVWSATMELAVVGHQDGTRYTSDFTPPLSTLDEDIPLDWLQQSGYCESPEDCQWRVDNNQLCRGHYSYDVIFQRTW